MTGVVKISDRILSPTSINTYLYCPRKFYRRYFEKLRTKPSIHLIRGHIVHQVLHQFHKNHPEISSSVSLGSIRTELLATFNHLWEKAHDRLDNLGLTEDQLDYYKDDSELMLFNYSHWFIKRGMLSPDLTEARFFSKRLRLMGIVDAVLEKDDQVILIDYKTSKRAEITDDIRRQAAIYTLLYEDRFGTVPEKVWIHFLKEPGDPMPVHIDDPLLDYTKVLIESVREKTTATDKAAYPCTCGGYCERDFSKK